MSDYGHASCALARLRAHDEGNAAAAGSTCPYPDGSPESRSWWRGHGAIPPRESAIYADPNTGVAVVLGPSPADLWQQAEGDADRYRELMREHGHLILGKPEPLPCGWLAGRPLAPPATTPDPDANARSSAPGGDA